MNFLLEERDQSVFEESTCPARETYLMQITLEIWIQFFFFPNIYILYLR